MLTPPSKPSVGPALVVAFVVLAGVHAVAAEAPAQKKFAKPADAVRALAGAARTRDEAALLAILGQNDGVVEYDSAHIDRRGSAHPARAPGHAMTTRLDVEKWSA